jgi:TrmH family RNA methyltransferase
VHPPKQINSAANPRYKALRKLAQSSQERRKTGLSVLDGAHLAAAYRRHVGRPRSIAAWRIWKYRRCWRTWGK